MVESNDFATQQAVLELRVADAQIEQFAGLFERLHASGIVFGTLRSFQATEPRWIDHFTDLDNATRSGTGNPEVPRTVDAMAARISDLHLDPDACFIARHGERFVGYSLLDTARSSTTRLQQSWTGVRPEYRRRGIGTALKVQAVRYAQEHGYDIIVTTTRLTNVASQAMSRRVGFRAPGTTSGNT